MLIQPFSDNFLQQATEVLRAIGHPVRLQIIELLFHQKKLTVTQIHEALDVPQPVVSNHLRLLKDRGVVHSVRNGQNSIYALTDSLYFEIIYSLRNILQ